MEIAYVIIFILLFFVPWFVWLTKVYLKLEKEAFIFQLELNKSIFMIEQDLEVITSEIDALSGPRTIKLHWMKKQQ